MCVDSGLRCLRPFPVSWACQCCESVEPVCLCALSEGRKSNSAFMWRCLHIERLVCVTSMWRHGRWRHLKWSSLSLSRSLALSVQLYTHEHARGARDRRGERRAVGLMFTGENVKEDPRGEFASSWSWKATHYVVDSHFKKNKIKRFLKTKII